ncbi:MAG: 5'/3'-nucleotidase SurE [Anaerolineales bacterium]|nr:5'/3'-nucleotidase SurE [Anaerolineales bacterium]
MKDTQRLILLSNDDGIRSPGLWAAAEALSTLGYVVVAAPREQQSAMGRSKPSLFDKSIHKETKKVGKQSWEVYAISGSPAQSVSTAINQILPRKPDLVVAGINYGENLGSSVTVSGTVGAALEGASYGIPAMAVSLQTPPEFHFSYSEEIHFEAAAHFTAIFGKLLLEEESRRAFDVLKVDVPAGATVDTPWEMTRVSRSRYYFQKVYLGKKVEEGELSYAPIDAGQETDEQSDIYVVRVKKHVSISPLTLDLTAGVNRAQLADQFCKRIADSCK